ncbi:MAG: Phosphotransferase enzyme family protein [Candidatus Lokiarchaeum sp. GC14_75]|nr:MAG: Phosphotransferase enzyme family protein [Candidatus Lokiarchaeum sp. GC14_75]
MIVKMPIAFRAIVNSPNNFYEREIRFYNEIAPLSPVRVPDVIYSDYDLETNRYILILEDCSQYRVVHQLEGLNQEQTKQIITSIADFHARWWDAHDLFSFDWIPKPKSEYLMSFVDIFRITWDFSTKSDEFLAFLPEDSRKIGDKLYEQMPWLINSDPDQNLTITHYDLRSENIFFDYNNRENPIIILDWGTAIISVGILDLAYLLAGSIKIDLRRKIEKDMIKFYLKRLEKKGINGLEFEFFWNFYLKSLLRYSYLVPLSFTQLQRDSEVHELGTTMMKRIFTAIIDNDAISICPI